MKLAKDLTGNEVEQYIAKYERDQEKKDKETFDRISEILSSGGVLTVKELYDVASWKTQRVSKRVKENNSDPFVGSIIAFALKIPDEKYKIRPLCSLHGIGVPRASAILSMSDPKRYGVIDANAWYSLTGKEKRSFNADDWMSYLSEIRKLAGMHQKTPRKIDMALMKHGQELFKQTKGRAE
jgi:hypothetical protein